MSWWTDFRNTVVGGAVGGVSGAIIGHEKQRADDRRDAQDKVSASRDEINDGYADMMRSEYDDWKKRFEPYEELQRDMVLDPSVRGKMHSNALGYVDKSVDNAVGQTKATMLANDKRFGRVLTPEQQARRNKRLGNQQALSKSAGRTQMKQGLRERRLGMLSGGV